MPKVVVRFAPSPTGYLHIGGARTAIFNWLYARKNNGLFILRIEDTDSERLTQEAIQGIVEGLRWLGIDWDKGPYFQSEHIKEHLEAAQVLIDNGWAYKCFCGKAELDAKREQAINEKRPYHYDRACRYLTKEMTARRQAAGEPYVIRLKVPDLPGTIVFEDRVYGTIEKRYKDMDDFVIVRANGKPLYILSNTVDDIHDGITHVIRGQDGLDNTPKQLLIYKGLQAALPQFAHMSLTLDQHKAKISKRRHGELVSIHHYRNNGFLPWAMVNFLVLLGWSTSDARQHFNQQELMEAFDLEGIGRSNSVFNICSEGAKFITDPKLLNMNAHYIKNMELDELVAHVGKQFDQQGANRFFLEKDQLFFIVDLIRTRCQVLTDFTTYGHPYFSDDFEMDAQALKTNIVEHDAVRTWLPQIADQLEKLEPYTAEAIESVLRVFLKKNQQLKAKQVVNAVRTAVTGNSIGPDVVRVLECVGQQRVVRRLRKALSTLDVMDTAGQAFMDHPKTTA